MSKVSVTKDKLDILANAIANKSGEPLTLTLDEMVEAVDGIDTSGGGITPSGNIDITQAGVTDVTNYATATVPETAVIDNGINGDFSTISGVRKWNAIAWFDYSQNGMVEGGINYATKTIRYNAVASGTTITPTTSSQTVGGADYMMEGAVTVSAVPSASFFTGADGDFFTESGVRVFKVIPFTDLDTSEGDVEGFISDGTHQLGDPLVYSVVSATTVTPTESAQTVGGINHMMEGAVTVNAIPSNYVGSGITQRSSTDLTVSGATVTAPAGYYGSSASKAVASGSATAAATISGTAATVSTGTNTLTLSKTVSNTPQVTAGYVASGTAGNSSVSLTANVTTKGTATITPTTSNQTIASGTYLTGTQTISGDANLVAGNIKSGTTIFGVTGTYAGGGSLTVATKTLTNNATTQTLSFSSLSGQPKYWFLRATTNVSSSGSTTYYYVTDCFYDGTSVKGNTFRIGSTRRVQNVTSGITQSYSGGTLTITAGSSSGATPGQFYGASNFGYELVYVY